MVWMISISDRLACLHYPSHLPWLKAYITLLRTTG